VAGRSFGRLRADRPLISHSGDLDGEAPVAEWNDERPAAHIELAFIHELHAQINRLDEDTKRLREERDELLSVLTRRRTPGTGQRRLQSTFGCDTGSRGSPGPTHEKKKDRP